MRSAIQCEGLSKRYILGAGDGAEGLRHRLERVLRHPARLFGGRRGEVREFWAIRDVSFTVREGDVTAVIGKNGAGKSTLLKILSRITEPTGGRARIRGRVGSLLEVGTGFHPELTGRENIFLNGAVLGMRRTEVRAKFDAIVAFAEIEQFLDTPVKHYSSGMYVRLAFAVAAHLEPEILLVDEVLAVGDVQFQRKCLGKMNEVSRQEGRTVLFVSHNMPAVAQLCRRGLLLDMGRVVREGSADDVIAEYLKRCSAQSKAADLGRDLVALRKRKRCFFRGVEVLNCDRSAVAELDVRRPFLIRVVYEVPNPLTRLELAVRILSSDGRAVMTSLQSEDQPEVLAATRQGVYEAEVEFPGMFLMPGEYFINVAAHEPMGEIFDLVENAASLRIQDTGTVFYRYGNHQAIGVVLQKCSWREKSLAENTGAVPALVS